MQVETERHRCSRVLALLFRRCFSHTEVTQAAQHLTIFEPAEDSFEANIDLAESTDGQTNIATDPRFETGAEMGKMQRRRLEVTGHAPMLDAMNITFGESSCVFTAAEGPDTRETESEGK